MSLANRKPLGIQRRYLHDEAADRLRELILSGRLAPGERVNEVELSEAFGRRGATSPAGTSRTRS
jgi:DNA-binding GntR family transcriptional regulator